LKYKKTITVPNTGSLTLKWISDIKVNADDLVAIDAKGAAASKGAVTFDTVSIANSVETGKFSKRMTLVSSTGEVTFSGVG